MGNSYTITFKPIEDHIETLKQVFRLLEKNAPQFLPNSSQDSTEIQSEEKELTMKDLKTKFYQHKIINKKLDVFDTNFYDYFLNDYCPKIYEEEELFRRNSIKILLQIFNETINQIPKDKLKIVFNNYPEIKINLILYFAAMSTGQKKDKKQGAFILSNIIFQIQEIIPECKFIESSFLTIYEALYIIVLECYIDTIKRKCKIKHIENSELEKAQKQLTEIQKLPKFNSINSLIDLIKLFESDIHPIETKSLNFKNIEQFNKQLQKNIDIGPIMV